MVYSYQFGIQNSLKENIGNIAWALFGESVIFCRTSQRVFYF
ncbi:hypothetical protein AsAng_0028120 [Aureispira anguillae]|uniref:Uncharacterized protein n=1 Tax=Aureispira anguillae TaxID=2864201 RepID=A0A915YFH9_9BACT|nr:hypothetical protein AsAng_0028120 [Aureispira anguillae]